MSRFVASLDARAGPTKLAMFMRRRLRGAGCRVAADAVPSRRSVAARGGSRRREGGSTAHATSSAGRQETELMRYRRVSYRYALLVTGNQERAFGDPLA